MAAPHVRIGQTDVGSRLIDRILAFSRARIGAAIVYHRVDDAPGDPQRELSPAMGLAAFESQLNWLIEHFEIVSAHRLLPAIEARRRRRRLPIALTFDDDVDSHVRDALPVLRRLDVPATFFLGGTSLTGPFSHWWERLERAVALGVEPAILVAEGGFTELESLRRADVTVHELGRAVADLPPKRRQEYAEYLATVAGPDPADAGIRAADVRALVAEGFDVGFHPRGHDTLTRLNDEALAAAFVEGRGELEEVAGRRLNTVAYPHGKADERVAEAARAAGFTLGFVVRNRAVAGGADPLRVHRLVPPLTGAPDLRRQVAGALAREIDPPRVVALARRIVARRRGSCDAGHA